MANELGFNVESTLPFDAAVTRVRKALKQEGFGVLSEIDLRDPYVAKLLQAHAEVVTRSSPTAGPK